MKKLLVGTLVLTSLSAFATLKGLPSQDPVIRMLRNKFETSKEPTVNQLILGKFWDCKEFNAFKDSFKSSTISDALKFSQYDGLIVNAGTGRITNMIFDGTALTGLRSTDHGMVFIRASENGDLIIENTTPTGSVVDSKNGIEAISDKLLYAYSYVTCPVSTIH